MKSFSSDRGAAPSAGARTNPFGAFVPHAPFGDYGVRSDGALDGTTLAVKDLFDVAGFVTGAGSPAWAEGRGAASVDALAVTALRAAGARLVGKTQTDELAWSLDGENAHYGTPENPAAPGRIPGGSSSGSAAAVAGGLADIGLGTDTGGSIHLPAAYCGLWGMRPTHGRIPVEGVVPLAPSYDTVGWLARSPDMLANAGAVLVKAAGQLPKRMLIAQDLFHRVVPAHAPALRRAAAKLAEDLGLQAEGIRLCPEGSGTWRDVFRVCQSAEVWDTHGHWVRRARPRFGPGIAERFAMAAALDPAEVARMRVLRRKIAARLHDLLGSHTVLLVPGAGAPPPLRGLAASALEDLRNRALEVLCPAGHAGLPQLSLPALRTPEGPIGLGIIGPAGADAMLLALGRYLAVPETAA